MLRQMLEGALDVVGGKSIMDGFTSHVLVLRAQVGGALAGPDGLHVVEEAAGVVGDEVGAECPGGVGVTEGGDEIWYAGVHHAFVEKGLGEINGLTIYRNFYAAQNNEVETGGSDDDVGFQFLAGLE